MAREFMWVRPDGTWKGSGSLDECMAAAKEQCKSGLGPYTLKKDEKVLRRGIRSRVLRGLRRALETGNVGPTYRIRSKERVLFTCREVVPAIKIIDTNGNDKADRCWSFAKAKFGDIRFLGAYVCKQIAGTSTMSQHSYGNAVDFGRDSMQELVDLYDYLKAHADELDIEHLIVGNRIWQRGSGESYYGGVFHYHVHADFTPQYSGSCGVRG